MLIGAYAFTQRHLDRMLAIADMLRIGRMSELRNGEDILLSFAGDSRPRIHALVPFLTSHRNRLLAWPCGRPTAIFGMSGAVVRARETSAIDNARTVERTSGRRFQRLFVPQLRERIYGSAVSMSVTILTRTRR